MSPTQRIVTRAVRRIAGAALAGVVLLVFPAAGHAVHQSVLELDAPRAAEVPLALKAGRRVTFETRDCSAGADPVLHLLGAGLDQVAVNDNRTVSTREARLIHTPTRSGVYRLLVRPRSSSSAGTCEIERDGHSWRRVSFDGGLARFALRRDEVLETVALPNGATGRHRLHVLRPDGIGIERTVMGGGIAGGARLRVPSDLGDRQVLLLVQPGAEGGRLRLVQNDAAIAGRDGDGDSLGSELELEIGTCPSRTGRVNGFDCSRTADARDTDGDGISDGWELLGRSSSAGDQPLPLWGADPRHKDLFVEVDFMRRTKAENDAKTSLMMPPDVARSFARFYGDAQTTNTHLREIHAYMLRNPDGQPGIAVHLDTGVAPQTPEDATTYGNWGGYTAVNAVKDDGTWKGLEADEAWEKNMNAARRGIFRYALAYGDGGGQEDEGFTASYNFNSSFVAPHETGHTMGLGHSGPIGGVPVDVNCKPNYPSLMNYAYDDGDVGFADGGVVSSGVDGHRGYFPPLDNAALVEHDAVPPENRFYLDVLERKFGYSVDWGHGHVDWNRDGRFAPAGSTVRAYANYRAGRGCEYTRWNQLRVEWSAPFVTVPAKANGAPALARLGDRLYAFYARGKTLYYTSTSSKLRCPEPVPRGCDGTKWRLPHEVGIDAWSGFDVERIADERILVVAIDAHGKLVERRLRLEGGDERWSSPVTVPTLPALGPPSLAAVGDRSVAYVAYRDVYQHVVTNRLDGSGWDRWEYARRDHDQTVAHERHAAPAIVEATLNGMRGLYGAFVDPSDERLDIWYLDSAVRRWVKTDLIAADARPGGVKGRPAIAWVPPGAAGGGRGRLYLAYPHRTDDDVLRMLVSYTAPVYGRLSDVPAPPLRDHVGLKAYFDNQWAAAQGIALGFEPGGDTNLRALLVRSDGEVWLRPKADGISDHTYRNANDWNVLRVSICRHVVDPGGTVDHPIACPDKSW